MRLRKLISIHTHRSLRQPVFASALLMTCSLAIPSLMASSPQSPEQPSQSANRQRREQLLADTAKLLQLANELKAEVDKSTKDTLSINVIKKADEVGKLARKVKEEMKAAN